MTATTPASPVDPKPPGVHSTESLDDLRTRLVTHPIYAVVDDLPRLRIFMEHHAVCVLDFMSLLKRLQRSLTCIEVPWTPASHARVVRFVNELVLDEESDAAAGLEPISHYAWYLEAMREVGADSNPVQRLEARLRAGVLPAQALEGCGLPPAAVNFARTTFELAAGPDHVVAAAFFHGREDLIPSMFLPLVAGLGRAGVECGRLRAYLQRHIEIDGEAHGPLAQRLLESLHAGEPERRREADAAAFRALCAREQLWDAVVRACDSSTARRPASHVVLPAARTSRT